MGGMAAQIPIKNDPEANELRSKKSAATNCAKSKMVTMARGWRIRGWCQVAMEVFDEFMPQANQIDRQRDDVNVYRCRPAQAE